MIFVLFNLITFVCGVIVFGWFLQTPNASKKISAFKMGAEYLDNKGVVLQTKYNNCGPSALKMIFDYYKIASTLEEIDNNVGLTKKGSSMLALKEMAELKGLKAEGWKLTLDDFMKRQFPVLLFVHENHYIIADSVGDNEVFIRDPAIGRLKMNKNKLTSIWNGEAIIFTLKNNY